MKNQKKQFEQKHIKIEEQQDFFQSVAENAGVGMVVLSRDFKIIWANSIITNDLIGDEVVGKTCYGMYAGRESICDDCGVVSIFEGKVLQWTSERKGQDCNGNEIWSEVTASPCTFDENGVVTSVMEVVIPITDRKKAEEELKESRENLEKTVEERTRALKESEASLRYVFEAVDDVSFIKTDINGLATKILGFNAGAENIFGYRADEVIGKPVSILHLKEYVEHIPEILEKIRNERKSFSGESTLVRKSGEQFPAIISIHPVSNDIGEVVAAVGVGIDITERVKVEEALHKMQKLNSVATLAGGIAHDFNNLLTGIIGYVDLARVNSSSKAEVMLDKAKKASLRAKDLTTQLLTFAKGGNPVKVAASVKKVIVESADFAIHGSSVVCDYNIPSDLWSVKIDTSQMSQVIQNIVINSIAAMSSGGLIKVSCENCIDCPECLVEKPQVPGIGGQLQVPDIGGQPQVPGAGSQPQVPGAGSQPQASRWIKIAITDTGKGIKQELIDKVFDPYFTTREMGDEKGCGLGLSICYSIIKKHGGEIQIESEIGTGTTVTIYLPASLKSVEPPAAKDECETESLSRARVMVMDDESVILNLASQMLECFGHDVLLAENGDEAIDLYQEHFDRGQPIDIVIADLTIPGGKGGREVVQEILNINPSAKVVVTTGYSNDPVMANYAEYGFTATLAKPFEINDLRRLINSLLHKNSVD